MLTKSNKRSRLFFLIFLSAIALTSVFLISIQAAKARGEKSPRQLKTDKVCPLLKSNRHRADQTVTVIVTLNEPKSGLLNAFMNRTGVQQRQEMKKLGVFSLSLPFGMVAELASFPEISSILNETVRSFGHLSTTSGADAAKAARAPRAEG